jgi:hypothetical protein
MTKQRTTPRTAVRLLGVGGVAAATAVAVLGVAAPASAETTVEAPPSFTSAYTVMATPDQVVNADGVTTPGPTGATGTFTFMVNSTLDIICYDITVSGISGDYMSPAKTATHIHAASVDSAGPPRIAFPNPAPIGDGPRMSSGCLQGPFTTGVMPDGADTGTGFTLAQLEANPAGFAADTHTVANPAGAVRGQLTQIPVGGVQTGGGGIATDGRDASGAVLSGLGALTIAGIAGVVLHRRRSATSSN